jgi:hypothetical protein
VHFIFLRVFYISSYGVALIFHVSFILSVVVFTSCVLLSKMKIYIPHAIYISDIVILSCCDAYNLIVFLFYAVMLPV